MPQGLQIYRKNSTIALDLTDRIPKFLGTVDLDGSAKSGTVQNDELNEGDLWYLILTLSYPDPDLTKENNSKWETPTITKGDKCFTWSFPQDRKVSCRILYGVY